MIENELIEKKIDTIEEKLKYLNKNKKIPQEKFLKSYEKTQAVKHTLQETIEATIDIANHILAAKKLGRSETYSEMFQKLAENNLIKKELADKLSDMAKFRNLLVHQYAKIDDKKVYDILQENLKDIEKFLKEIEKLLQKN